jgi:hypothetical protein
LERNNEPYRQKETPFFAQEDPRAGKQYGQTIRGCQDTNGSYQRTMTLAKQAKEFLVIQAATAYCYGYLFWQKHFVKR